MRTVKKLLMLVVFGGFLCGLSAIGERPDIVEPKEWVLYSTNCKLAPSGGCN